MAYTKITKFNSPNYTPQSQVPYIYGRNRTIESITIHWWGDPRNNPSFEGVVSWLCRAGGGSSAHTVSTGTSNRVAWIVDAINAAWHAGSAIGNATSIGLELDPRARASDYAVAAELIADIWISYKKKLPLRAHKYWFNTACPGAYDLNRLKKEADVWYTKKTKPATTTPTVKLVRKDTYSPAKKFKVTTQTTLVNIPANTKYSGSKTYKVGETVDNIVEKLTYSDGKSFYRTKYARDYAKKMYGFGVSKLTEIVPEPKKPEWIENLSEKDLNKKLSVLPAEGTRVIDLNTLKRVGDNIIPKGTQIDVMRETTVLGKKYYISAYAMKTNAANGILASHLGVPVTPPANEKPEWLENLKDIEDKVMWTRSQTPVLDIENGSTLEILPINKEVKITHATQIVDKDLLVLEGQKKVIETIYLSDTKIEEPYKDLEERVSLLETMLKSIAALISQFLGKK